jgi:putative ABC transport system permease protein
MAQGHRPASTGLRLIAALVLAGVTALAASTVVSTGLIALGDVEAREAVGGDVSIRMPHRPLDEGLLNRLRWETAAHSRTAFVRAPVRIVANASPMEDIGLEGAPVALAEISAVDANYPLAGPPPWPRDNSPFHADFRSGEQVTQEEMPGWAFADASLLEALNAGIGDTVVAGDMALTIQGTLPEDNRLFAVGPRLLVPLATFETSALADTGASVFWYDLFLLPQDVSPRRWVDALSEDFPDAPWRIVIAADGVPGLERLAVLARSIMTVAGVVILMIAGVGIAGAVAADTARQLPVLAILQATGVRPGAAQAYLTARAMVAAAMGALIGAAIGGFGPGIVSAALPIMPTQPFTIPLAGLIGLLIAYSAVSVTVHLSSRQSPASILRGGADPTSRIELWGENDEQTLRKRTRRAGVYIWPVAALLLAFGIVASTSAAPTASLVIMAATGALAVVLSATVYIAGGVVGRLMSRIQRCIPLAPRLAVNALRAPGALAGPAVVALTLAVAALIALLTVTHNAREHFDTTLQANAPDRLIINLEADAARDLVERVDALGGESAITIRPFVHARLTAIDGTATADRAVPGAIAWAVRGDRGMDWSNDVPAADPETPGISVDRRVAAALGIGTGSTLTFAFPDRPRMGIVVAMHDTDWTGLTIDAPFRLSTLSDPPPHRYIAAVRANSAALADIETLVGETAPTSAVVNVNDIVDRLGRLVQWASQATAPISAVSIVTALLVLSATALALHRRRRADDAILAALGARTYFRAGVGGLEVLIIILSSIPLGLGLGIVGGYALVQSITPETWSVPWMSIGVVASALILGPIIATVAASYAALRRTSPGRNLVAD